MKRAALDEGDFLGDIAAGFIGDFTALLELLVLLDGLRGDFLGLSALFRVLLVSVGAAAVDPGLQADEGVIYSPNVLISLHHAKSPHTARVQLRERLT